MSVNQGRVMDVHEIVNKLQNQATGRRNGDGPSPAGNIDIEQNGVYDVTDYAQATVQVPNTYAAGDEGKVVSGGALVSQTGRTLTENGTYDTTENNSVIVNVPSSGGISIDDIITCTEPSGAVVAGNTVTTVGASALYRKPVTSFVGNGVTEVKAEAFMYCPDLVSVYIGGHDAIIGQYALRYCPNLKEIRIPYAKSNMSFGGYGLTNDSKLELIDFGQAAVNVPGYPANTPLKTIIVRRSTVAPLTANTLNNSSAFMNGGTGGDVYIPKSLYDQLGSGGADDYKAAANWSTYDGYGTITWHPIEGSIYEL